MFDFRRTKNKTEKLYLNDNAKCLATAELLMHKRKSQKFYKTLEESVKTYKEPNSKILRL